jgi:lysophospholipase L1-like esterase
MPNLLAYGDSNTHGTPPIVTRGVYQRFDAATRWPQACLRALGPEWTLAEEGLPGRTAQYDDPVMGAHMNGRVGLRIALESHGPLDVLALMLGTNDVKTRFASTPEMVVAGLAGLLDVALSQDVQARHGGFKILLICPPPVLEVGPIKAEFFGARARSLALAPLFSALAASRGVGFFDAGSVIEVSPQDGIHFEASAHRVLGAAIAAQVLAL